MIYEVMGERIDPNGSVIAGRNAGPSTPPPKRRLRSGWQIRGIWTLKAALPLTHAIIS